MPIITLSRQIRVIPGCKLDLDQYKERCRSEFRRSLILPVGKRLFTYHCESEYSRRDPWTPEQTIDFACNLVWCYLDRWDCGMGDHLWLGDDGFQNRLVYPEGMEFKRQVINLSDPQKSPRENALVVFERVK